MIGIDEKLIYMYYILNYDKTCVFEMLIVSKMNTVIIIYNQHVLKIHDKVFLKSVKKPGMQYVDYQLIVNYINEIFFLLN